MSTPFRYKLSRKVETILATSCWHIGNPTAHMDGIHLFIEKAKKHPWVHHGDIIEGITRGDSRFAVGSHQEALLDCMSRSALLIGDARDTCVGVVSGNHEATPSRDIGDVTAEICRQARVKYFGSIQYIEYECGTTVIREMMAHGNGTANYRTGAPERKRTNKQVKLRDLLQPFSLNTDICGIGHMHKGIVTPPVMEEVLGVDENGEIKKRPRSYSDTWFYACPSMFLTYDFDGLNQNYAAMKMYPSTDIGWIEIDVDKTGVKCIRIMYADGQPKEEFHKQVIS